MEFIIISDNKMKIMLTQKDLDKYSIDGENFSICNDTQRHAFRHMLNDACRKSGFEGNASRLMVQMYPCKRGGCEIFVTKLDGTDRYAEQDQEKRGSAERSLFGDISQCGIFCYSFSEFSHLNTVCRQLRQSSFLGKSSIYADKSGSYYLILEPRDPRKAAGNGYGTLSFIDEFAVRSDPAKTIAYIEEYGKPICREGAVEQIGVL